MTPHAVVARDRVGPRRGHRRPRAPAHHRRAAVQPGRVHHARTSRTASPAPAPTTQRIRVQASPPNTQVWRGLVQFGLAGIPSGSTVNSAVAELSAGNNASDADAHPRRCIRITAVVAAERGQVEQRAAASARADGDGPRRHRPGLKAFDVTADVQAFVNALRRRSRLDGEGQNETGQQRQGELRHAGGDPSAEAREAAEAHRRLHAAAVQRRRRLRRHQLLHDERAVRRGRRASVTPVELRRRQSLHRRHLRLQLGCINADICNDGFSCTTDTCDPETLACTNTPNDAVVHTASARPAPASPTPTAPTMDPVTGCIVTSTRPTGRRATTTRTLHHDVCDERPMRHPRSTDVVRRRLRVHGAAISAAAASRRRRRHCAPSTSATTPAPATRACARIRSRRTARRATTAALCTAPDQCDGAGACVGGNPVDLHRRSTSATTPAPATRHGRVLGPAEQRRHAVQRRRRLHPDRHLRRGRAHASAPNPVVCAALDQCHDAGTCDSGTGRARIRRRRTARLRRRQRLHDRRRVHRRHLRPAARSPAATAWCRRAAARIATAAPAAANCTPTAISSAARRRKRAAAARRVRQGEARCSRTSRPTRRTREVEVHQGRRHHDRRLRRRR